jgi:hypothetical protein
VHKDKGGAEGRRKRDRQGGEQWRAMERERERKRLLTKRERGGERDECVYSDCVNSTERVREREREKREARWKTE